jgi:hypothetical protein
MQTMQNNTMNEDTTKHLFISWSKDRSKKIANELKKFIENVSPTLYPYISINNLHRGAKLVGDLEKAMDNSYEAFFVITPENTHEPWLHYELGYMVGKNKNINCTPILFGVNPGELSELFRERVHIPISFEEENKFKEGLKSKLSQIFQALNINTSGLDKTCDTHWGDFYSQIKEIANENEKTKIEILLFNNKINIESHNKDNGLISTIKEDDYWGLRNDIIQEKTEELTIVGSSLKQVFSTGTRQNDKAYLVDVLLEHLNNNTIKRLNIFLSEPKVFDEPIKIDENDETPNKRIESATNGLLRMLRRINNGCETEINIYFLPLFHLDHIVITDNFILSRNTMLWTNDSEKLNILKGVHYFGEKNNNHYGLYNSYKRYLEFLSNTSTLIDLSVPYDENVPIELNSKSLAIHYSFRNRLQKIKNLNIKLYKLYETQLKSSLRSTWLKNYRNVFREEGYSKSDEVFSRNGNIPNFDITEYKKTPLIQTNTYKDKSLTVTQKTTQQILLPYIAETELLLNQVVQKYDKDSGFAHIIPSFDLGVPNNIQRLGGGFATGSVVLWNCGTPIIPVDATVNICSSSVYEIDSDISNKLDSTFFQNLLNSANKEGFVYNFETSNHFIVFGKDEVNNKYYLVLHSSAKEYKYNALGLYPHEKSWYFNKIKTVYNENKDRYLRYIKDDDAIQFYKIVKSLNSHNVDVHDWFANEIVKNQSEIVSKSTKHHYGMPTSYCINIGTFLLDNDEQVPIFSDRGKKIAIVKPNNNNVNLLINGRQKSIIPHGWGQDFNRNVDSLKVLISESQKDKYLNIDEQSMIIERKGSLIEHVKVRDFFNTQEEFKESLNQYSSYEIVFQITPLVSVDKEGVYRKTNNGYEKDQ